MRLMSIAAITALIAPVGYFGSAFLVELNERIDERKVREAAVSKAAKSVLDATGLRFQQVVLGPGEGPDTLRFRGRVSTPGADSAQSAYGEIDMTCAGAPASPRYSACWTLTELMIDGAPAHETTAAGFEPRPIAAALSEETIEKAPAETPAVAALDEDAVASPEPTGGDVATAPQDLDGGSDPTERPPADADATASAPATPTPRPEGGGSVAAGPAEEPAEESATTEAPAAEVEEIALAELSTSAPPTHEVQRSLVNARTGPSIDDEVRTQLTAGTSLRLLAEEGRWGRFQILDGADQDLEVWIAFSVLNAL